MAKKLKSADLEKIIQPLSKKERAKLKEQNITVPWLEESIETCKNLMKRDTYIGIPWFIASMPMLCIRPRKKASSAKFGKIFFVNILADTAPISDVFQKFT